MNTCMWFNFEWSAVTDHHPYSAIHEWEMLKGEVKGKWWCRVVVKKRINKMKEMENFASLYEKTCFCICIPRESLPLLIHAKTGICLSFAFLQRSWAGENDGGVDDGLTVYFRSVLWTYLQYKIPMIIQYEKEKKRNKFLK